MARLNRAGVDYFPVDVAFLQDRRVAVIRNKHGFSAISVIMAIYCEIYRDGGYFLHLPDADFSLLADRLGGGCTEAYVKKVVLTALETGLFDKAVYGRTKALTSKRVQKQYVRICENRKLIVMDKKYFILERSDVIDCGSKGLKSLRINDNGDIGLPDFNDLLDLEESLEADEANDPVDSVSDPINSDFGTQSKVKQSKVKQTESESHSETESKPAPRGLSPPKRRTGDDDEGECGDNAVKSREAVVLALLPDYFNETERGVLAGKLGPWLDCFPAEVIALALSISLEHGNKTWAYIGKVLQNWKDSGCKNISDVHAAQEKWRKKSKKPDKKYSRFADYNHRVTDFALLEELAMKKLHGGGTLENRQEENRQALDFRQSQAVDAADP